MVKYKVTLTQEEREDLEGIISKGKHSSQVYRNAYMLLNCDEGKFGEKITGKEICRVSVPARTIRKNLKASDSFTINEGNKAIGTGVIEKVSVA